MSERIQEHPDYAEGYYDALDMEPLFANEATAAYQAGWRAAWECKQILADAWFQQHGPRQFSKTTIIGDAPNDR
ncbi:hypothetical protein LJR164_001582 [Phenylobacterium sp. LjRoot164]|uniref:hypothetical protein n=1 Tax=unclassified Phenylobacterium TaxID=2640670 RepID=UPI003ECC5CAC